MRALGPHGPWGTWGGHRRPVVNLLLESRARDSKTDVLGELPVVGETTRGRKLWAPEHREGSSYVPAGSLGGCGAHDHAPVIDFPHPGSCSCSRKKEGCAP